MVGVFVLETRSRFEPAFRGALREETGSHTLSEGRGARSPDEGRGYSRHRRDSRVFGCSCAQRTIGFAFAARSDAAKTIQYCFCQGKPKAKSRQSRVYRGDRRRLCDGVFSGSSLTISRRRACKFSPQARFPCFDLIFHDIHPNRRLDI